MNKANYQESSQGISEVRALKEPQGESTPAKMSQVQAFYRSLRTEATMKTYAKALHKVFQSDAGAEEFLTTASKNRKEAESILLDWLYESQKTLSGSSVRTFLAAAKSFCDFAELPTPLNWKKITKSAPRYSKSQDRPVKLEEIRRLFIPGDLRFKFMISLLASSGCRIGAFDYFRMRDFEIIEVEDTTSKLSTKKIEIAKLHVYGGEPEAYTAFVSFECVQLFRAYREERERSGEVLRPDSALFRNLCSFKTKKKGVDEIISLGSTSLSSMLTYAWRKAGFTDREFKCAHSFRKFFKTTMEGAGAKSILVEKLLGHQTALDSSYYRPSDDELAKEYAKFQSALFIDPALSLKNEKEEILKEARSAISSESSRVQTLEKQVSVLTQTINDLAGMLEKFKQEKGEK